MPGWRPCSEPHDRRCWLTNNCGDRFDINTDYESLAPKGVVRRYNLTVHEGWINADGINFTMAKLFDNSYPGPWLQACWGDTMEITVHNRLQCNGTSIHWHGIRQWLSMHMDGVNGITQCPIAPGDKFLYRWRVTQYGSSWYHSHYSLQYADGLTLHGPTSFPFDEAAKTPILMTDWGHNSAFEAVYAGPGKGLVDPSILLNGRGSVLRFFGIRNKLPLPEPHTIYFERPVKSRSKRYLLRLINTSFDTTFVFSIDNHRITVVSADFVPIRAYWTSSILVGIGQRYTVIVEANPISDGAPVPGDGNFWLRTYVAECANTTSFPKGYECSGILRYNATSTSLPTSRAWKDISRACSDEPYENLKPIIPWRIGPPANGKNGEEFDVVLLDRKAPRPYPLAAFSLERSFTSQANPLRLDYGDPTLLHTDKTGNWSAEWVVVPEGHKATDWIHLVIAGDRHKGNQTIGAHPIHLHGHDFAILQQAQGHAYDPSKLRLNLDNPPRRDVVLLPRNGFIVIAFRADNPGSWLMHCHIARHASEGLGLQILERWGEASKIWPMDGSPEIVQARRLCAAWHEWQAECKNWWSGKGGGCGRKTKDPKFAFQDDSGV